MSIESQTPTANYSSQNQKNIALDMADNLVQIGKWIQQDATAEKQRIELYLRLSRKNLDALIETPIQPTLQSKFGKFCKCFKDLEKQYTSGITNKKTWGESMIKLGGDFTQVASAL